MTDVRALLRSEQAARRSTQEPGEYGVSEVRGSSLLPRKKRKTVEDNEHGRKKAKSAPKEHHKSLVEVEKEDKGNSNFTKPSALHDPGLESVRAINEDEWAAFERDIATAPQPEPMITALNATAVIQAPPLSAAEIASQAKEGLNTQKARREAELEDEKEDAARQLANELEEMESLEGRVRKLRDRKEALEALRQRPGEFEKPSEADLKNLSDDTVEEADDNIEDLWDAWGFNGA